MGRLFDAAAEDVSLKLLDWFESNSQPGAFFNLFENWRQSKITWLIWKQFTTGNIDDTTEDETSV